MRSLADRHGRVKSMMFHIRCRQSCAVVAVLNRNLCTDLAKRSGQRAVGVLRAAAGDEHPITTYADHPYQCLRPMANAAPEIHQARENI